MTLSLRSSGGCSSASQLSSHDFTAITPAYQSAQATDKGRLCTRSLRHLTDTVRKTTHSVNKTPTEWNINFTLQKRRTKANGRTLSTSPPSKLPQMVALLSCIRVLIGSNLGRDTDYPEDTNGFTLTLTQIPGSYSRQATTTSFQIIPNSLFTDHSISQHYWQRR
jgi:hypothetical protein